MKKILLISVILMINPSLVSAQIQIRPGIGYGINLNNNLSGPVTPYVGLGPTIAVGTKAIRKIVYIPASSSMEELEEEITYKTGLGFNVCLGADYELNNIMSITFGAVFRLVAVKREKSKITKWIIDGKDQIANKKTSEKEAEYKENITEADMNARTENDPCLFNTYIENQDALTFNLGIVLEF